MTPSVKTFSKLLLRGFALAFALCLCSLESGIAQARRAPRPLESGETVRIAWRDGTARPTHPIQVQQFDLVRVDANHVIVRRADRMTVIGRHSIESFRRRIGTRPATATEMAAGSGIGFGAAFLVGWMASSPSPTESRVDAGLSMGVLVGAPIGALVAWAASRSRGIYEDIPLPNLTAEVTPVGGGLGVVARIPAP